MWGCGGNSGGWGRGVFFGGFWSAGADCAAVVADELGGVFGDELHGTASTA